MPAGDLRGQRLAGFGELLFGRRARRDHHGFARHGLDSSNAFCGPFPCSVLGKQQAAFGGINPAVGSNVMYFPSGRSQYPALHLAFKTSMANPTKQVARLDMAIAYAWSRYRTNIAERDGSGGDYSLMNVAEDYNRPHRGHFGDSGMDRTHQLSFTSTADLPHRLRLSMIAHLASPLPLSAYVPQQDGGGVAGEIFRSDLSGDGTVGDLLPGFIGTTGRYSTSKLTQSIASYNSSFAGKLTPAGTLLAASGLFTGQELVALGAYAPLIQPLPGHFAEATWLKTIDLRLNWPLHISERVMLEPSVSVFNVFNFANFGGPGNQLNGVLNGAPGSSLNNASSAGFCGIPLLSVVRAWTGFWPVPVPTPTVLRGRWSSECESCSSGCGAKSRGKAPGARKWTQPHCGGAFLWQFRSR